jgi:hypothetical protein
VRLSAKGLGGGLRREIFDTEIMGKVKAGDDIFFTLSMAEVFEEQGYLEDALTIYKILADTSPGDPALGLKIKKLKSVAERSRKIKRDL